MSKSALKWSSLATLLILMATLCCLQPAVHAQESKTAMVETSAAKSATEGDEARNRVYTLGEIEVVARGEESKNTSIDKVYYDEMRRFDRNNLADAVNLLPGVTLSEAGARNELMLYLRGFDLKRVPIYQDGIPIYVPYDGYPDLGRFTTFDLSEIVVSKALPPFFTGLTPWAVRSTWSRGDRSRNSSSTWAADMHPATPTTVLATSAPISGNGTSRLEGRI